MERIVGTISLTDKNGKRYSRKLLRGASGQCFYMVGRNQIPTSCTGAPRAKSPRARSPWLMSPPATRPRGLSPRGRSPWLMSPPLAVVPRKRGCSPPRSMRVVDAQGKSRCKPDDLEYGAACLAKGKIMHRSATGKRTCFSPSALLKKNMTDAQFRARCQAKGKSMRLSATGKRTCHIPRLYLKK